MATAKKAVYKKSVARKAGIVLRKDGKPDRRFKARSNSKVVNNGGLVFEVNGQSVTLRKNGRNVGTAQVQVAGSSIGCGVFQVYSLNQLNTLCQAAGKSLAPQMVASLLTAIRKRHNASHVVLSNNERGPYVNDALNHVAVASKQRVSPRTHSKITVWSF